jgi:glycosyltransferase involved in cell wall biosynthesis
VTDAPRPPDDPVVSVVTPFFNTSRYLDECIQSVLGQTLTSFEYVLVDNQSGDGSGDIARRYAEHDPRIRVVTADRHRPQVENYNYALAQISPRTRYCKIVQADDWIFPECLEKMVAVAEGDARVGLVGCYHLAGGVVRGVGLPPKNEVFPGTEVARRQLLHGDFFVGSPTSIMYRASVVRDREPFYATDQLHEDTDAAYELLKSWDFGFVHQVLTFQRTQTESISGSVSSLRPQGLDKLIVLLHHGRAFLSADEYERTLGAHLRRYARSYVRGALGSDRGAFRRYHDGALAREGYRIPRLVLLRAVLAEVVATLGNPASTTRRIFSRGG